MSDRLISNLQMFVIYESIAALVHIHRAVAGCMTNIDMLNIPGCIFRNCEDTMDPISFAPFKYTRQNKNGPADEIKSFSNYLYQMRRGWLA